MKHVAEFHQPQSTSPSVSAGDVATAAGPRVSVGGDICSPAVRLAGTIPPPSPTTTLNLPAIPPNTSEGTTPSLVSRVPVVPAVCGPAESVTASASDRVHQSNAPSQSQRLRVQTASADVTGPPVSPPSVPVPLPPQNSRKLPHHAEWITRFDDASTPEDLETHLSGLVTEIQPPPKPSPTGRPPHRRRRQQNRQFDPQEASRLQRLFNRNQAKAVREILQPDDTRCQIDIPTIEAHFESTFGASPVTVGDIPIPAPASPVEVCDPLHGNFSPLEIVTRLNRTSNTAPGPDGIRYRSWRLADPDGTLLTAVFNCVKRVNHIPDSWKRSKTILIYKKGDPLEVGNWRPISLSDTIGKLFSAVIADRITAWAVGNNRISRGQKGFMPVQGCLEHNFLLHTTIKHARQSKAELGVAWLDLRNAFGSIPHQAILRALEWHGIPTNTIEWIKRLYDGCTTSVETPAGATRPIGITQGVKQGCPLSPIVFNLALEPVLRAAEAVGHGAEVHGQRIKSLAFADDVVLLGNSPSDLQNQLDEVSRLANWSGLSFNQKKCASLHITAARTQHGPRSDVAPTRFHLQGADVPAMTERDKYEYLGIPMGYVRHPSGSDAISQIKQDVENLHKSPLAPWQKGRVLNTFILPKLSFYMQVGEMQKGPLKDLDADIRRCAKVWLSVPKHASNEILYLPLSKGGFGITQCTRQADIGKVSQGYRILTSPDPMVRHIAVASLERTVANVVMRFRRTAPPTPEEIGGFLNGKCDGDLKHRSGELSTLWSRVRIATGNLRASIDVDWLDDLSIVIEQERADRKTIERMLRAAEKNKHLRTLLAKPEQGRCFISTSSTRESNHFIESGRYTRFVDWRFIFRARTRTLPLNAHRRGPQNSYRNCRHCQVQLETTAHVTNHCLRWMARHFTPRHNDIVRRLLNAANGFAQEAGPPVGSSSSPSALPPLLAEREVLENVHVPGCDEHLRPDIVILTPGRATIIDVTIVFDGDFENFDAARRRKREKYQTIADSLRSQGREVFLDAFILGALGSWDVLNDKVLDHLNIPPGFAKRLRRLMISDVIRHSRNAYYDHITTGRRPAASPQNQSTSSPSLVTPDN